MGALSLAGPISAVCKRRSSALDCVCGPTADCVSAENQIHLELFDVAGMFQSLLPPEVAGACSPPSSMHRCKPEKEWLRRAGGCNNSNPPT